MLKPRRIDPGPGQESVWDYPRPPRTEDVSRPVKVVFNGVTIAETTRAKRVLETSHPPTFYIHPADVQMQYLAEISKATWCEWKGQAKYYTVTVNGKRADSAAWCYPNPTRDFTELKDYITFYPQLMDACYVGDEQVTPQPGGFYGGWITSEVIGPFKGEPGTWGW